MNRQLHASLSIEQVRELNKQKILETKAEAKCRFYYSCTIPDGGRERGRKKAGEVGQLMTVIMYMDRHWYNTVHVLYMHVCLSENTMFRE